MADGQVSADITVKSGDIQGEARAKEPASAREAATVTGRTQWDAVTELGKFLGVLPMLFVILVAAVWFIEKQQSDQLRQANEALAKTYQQIGDMQTHMVEGVKNLMTLDKDMSEKLEVKRRLAEDTEKRASEAESRAADANQRAKVKADELAQLTDTKIQAEQSWAKLKDEKESLTKERDELKARLQNDASASGKQLESIRSRLADIGAELEQGAIEAAKAKLDEIRVEQLDIKSLLDRFATAPSFEAATNLERVLKGIPLEKFTAVVKEVTTWTSWELLRESESSGIVYGTRSRNENSLQWVVVFDFGKKSFDVAAMKSWFAVSGVDRADPLKTSLHFFMENEDGRVNEEELSSGDALWTTWDIAKIMKTERELVAYKYSRLYGTDYELPVLSPEDARKSFSALIQQLPPESPLPRMLTISERKNGWDASSPAVPGLDRLPQDLAPAFLEVINAAALGGSRLDDQIRKTGLDRAKFSKIAVAVLQPTFSIERVKDPAPRNPAQQSSAPEVTSNQRIVVASRSSRYARGEQVEFLFQRNSDSVWVLKDFRSGGLIEPLYQNKATAD